MSDVETVQTDAIAAPVENTATTQEQTQVQATESATEETAQQDEQARDEKGRFVQKRINELTKRYHDEARARASIEAEVRQLREQLNRATAPPPPDPNEDIQGWISHTAREEARSILESERQQLVQQQEHQRLAALVSESAKREAEYAQSHPDFVESIEAFVGVVGENPQLAEVLLTSEHGPAVVHYLGQHLDEAYAISQLPPHIAAAAIARLEAKVTSIKPKPVSAAPAPAPKLAGASVAPKGAHDGQSIEDWMRERNSQNR